MPCTKKMVQESGNASKPPYIYGHFFGVVGVLAGTAAKFFCLPLPIQVHDGDSTISGWLGDESVSHVAQMPRDGFRAAQYFGNSLFVLDRYFLTVPMLEEWKACVEGKPGLSHVITRAKKNCTAYGSPGAYKGRGRRPLHGPAVHLQDLFSQDASSFRSACIQMYGEGKQVRSLPRVYLWGQKLYQPLQFVLVEYGCTQAILVCTDLGMPAGEIIKACSCRFKIEAMFRELRQQFGGFCYRFWTKAAPRLDRYRRKGSPDPLTQVKDKHSPERVLKALQATEGYVMFSCIAMGTTQMPCLKYSSRIGVSSFRYLRTHSHKTMSEASMMEYLRRNLFRFMTRQGGLTITKIISDKQIPLEKEEIDLLIS